MLQIFAFYKDYILYGICVFFALVILVQSVVFRKKLRLIRSDAVKRSKAVINGQMVEQIAPFLPNFPCNPAEVRFIGKPVDFVGFSGLNRGDGSWVDEVLFIEVKTGDSRLNEREKAIKEAVKAGRVRYVEYRIQS